MIEFKHVNKKYPNGFEALKDIDLTIGQGEFVAIIGLSGAGKSTLIRTINRMHDITNGTLTVDGTDVMQLHGKSLRAFRRRIGMIFQSFNLVTRTTVIKNVLTAFVPELPWWRAALGIFTKAEKTAALEALDKVGILDKAFVRADQLSGGQQQRVALARTLAQNPQIILADEPVASLDPVTAKQVMDDFQRINRDMRDHHSHQTSTMWTWRCSMLPASLAFAQGAWYMTARPVRWTAPSWTPFIRTGRRPRHEPLRQVFPPKVIVLPNGKNVTKPRSRAPLAAAVLLALTVLSVKVTGFDMSLLGPAHQGILRHSGTDDTAAMELYASDLAGRCSTPSRCLCLALLSARCWWFRSPCWLPPILSHNRAVVSVMRLILSIIRTLPTLVTALIATYVFGLGTLAGTTAIAVFTFAYIGKILYEEIETVDMGAFEAMEAMGSTKVRAFISSIVPQVLPSYLSNCLFCFEGNVRYASILGYVGAGGLGLILNEKIGWREYSSVGMILLALFVTVFIIESISRAARKRLV